MKMKTKSGNTTNILLGIIAAEVVFLAVQALADRQTAPGKNVRPAEQPKPRKGFARYMISESLHHATGLLRRLFSSARADIQEGTQQVRARVESFRQKDESAHNDEGGGAAKSNSRNGEQDHGLDLRGNMQDIAAKLEDPAWTGVLAANDGNISLTEAERAVPMPKSAEFVERLDKNPYIGKGMKNHSRDEHMSHQLPPQVLKIPGVTGDR